MAKRDTKRNVDLVSSHSDNEDDEGPYLLCDEEDPSPVSELYRNTEKRLGVRPDENVIEYEEYIPDPNSY